MEKRLNDKKETFSKKIIANEYVRGAASFTAAPISKIGNLTLMHMAIAVFVIFHVESVNLFITF
jgi:hypothetical protein